ncbi:hypothetical protein PTMSG1_09698 [Pyrenophora teres f. maculata]|nr:hypothetical protein PTMSG1_09698 [Pyrenophora teres f. maculata]
MAPTFKTIILFAATFLPIALVSAGCSANVLNFNQADIANTCIPNGGVSRVRINGVVYEISATGTCGLSLASQRLPSGWSLQYGGPC